MNRSNDTIMKTTDNQSPLVDHYYSILKNWSSDDKLDLISRLSKSMKTDTEPEKDESWKSLFGALDLDETVEEFVKRLEKDRIFKGYSDSEFLQLSQFQQIHLCYF